MAMKFLANNLYHIYNQGNNQEIIFLTRDNYLRFLQKFRVLVSPHCNILAYCLMPNHFHFLIEATEKSADIVQLGNVTSNKLSNGFRLLLSEYAFEFNQINNRSGSLFRQKTKAKDLNEFTDINYPLTCFNYTHQNPFEAGLVTLAQDWEFSSLRDYLELRKGTICNQALAFNLLGISKEYIMESTLNFMKNENNDKKIF